MSNIPAELKYASSHEWIRKEEDGSYTVGISEHAQELLGDMVFIELPDVGDELNAGEDCAVAESVKAASDIYSPLTGEVLAVNEALEDSPELVNSDAFGDGWFFRVMPTDLAELENLLDAEGYQAVIDDE
ncbi:glycine cleavage system protein H [Shewanella sp. Choline-02u-19]|jgi:glycine cleavage system H protein|uniref:glycine cleavage system protein GcvH n=1 Tax=Shewanella TaxID=22 RepID=UPI000C333222|nr:MULTISPECIES: glycine cleavage system protein GcvH [Shewanella]MCL1058839.1 glycine cleavage system protein GcvH [Shewanella gelidimarina]PKG55926.1 glycine cleavage system protein H [Shewanella sp. GutDb-MelDb]PKG76612.1 glycine cleavage system protein H [Shewanella sp. GutCb]PKH56245.1 glycine cleavage system protein H [Shewanella sp. Bg11-22]PKI28685.1 glycine cleavage system protein H [Shewanella sp. Choline-02u-19]